LAQGLADQFRFGRQHDFGDADLLERLVALPLIEARQRHQSMSFGHLSRLLVAADHINSVLGLEYGLGHRR